MSTEDQSARLLADWLASPAGTPPPEGLEPEVVAAVYAMRPDRAPAPRVSIDDVFAAVKSGPFASGTAATEASAPAESARPASKVRASGAPPARGEGKRKGPSRWWMAPAALASLAAAAFALLVVPLVFVEGTPSDLMRKVAVSQEPAPAAVPMAGGGGSPDPEGTQLDAQGMPMSADSPKAAPPLAEMAATEPPSVAAAPAETAARNMADQRLEQLGYLESDPKPAPPPATPPLGGASAGAGAGGDALGWGQSATELKKEQPAPSRDRAYDTTSFAEEAPNEPAPLAPSTAAAPSPVIAEAESSSKADAEKQATISTVAASEQRREGAKAKSTTATSAPAGPTKKPSAQAPASSYAADADDEAGESSRSTSSRPAATPSDYDPSFYSARADVVSAFAAAETLRSSGQAAAAITAYTAWTRDGDARVAQEAAWRAAKLQRDAGQTSAALSTVNGGLQRSSSNTPQRSNLLLLRGDLYQALGRAAEAESAWAEAARLNSSR